MLGVQLYDLISQAGLKQEQVVAFYSFMSQLGMAAQAIDIVYQLNASEDSDPSIYQRGASPLESLSFGPNGASDVLLKSLDAKDRLLAFRYHDLILLKNYSGQPVSVRGRPLLRGGFCRIYPGQRILIGDQVLTYQELAAYFNAKKNVSLPQIFVRVPKDGDQVQLERARSRESSLEITFGLKVRVKALRDVDAVHQRREAEVGRPGRGDPRRSDRLPQRQRDGLDRSPPPRSRHGWPFPAQGLEVRISRLEQSELARSG